MSQLHIARSPAEGRPSNIAISWRVQIAAIASLAFYLHSIFWWTEPRDMALFQRPWFEHIVHYGPVGAFAHPFSNYTPAYLYLLAIASLFRGGLEPMYVVKLLSVAGTAFAALAVADLLRSTGGRPRNAALIFLMPSAIINAALLAQCDALWAGACVLAVAATIRGEMVTSLVWCGIAVAFKAQAVFLAPFIVGALIGRRAPLWQWSIPLLAFVAMMLPAWLAGWPASHLAMIYPSQPSWIPFPGRLANPWIFATIFKLQGAENFYWIGFLTVAAASLAIAAMTSTSVRNPCAMLLLALLSSLALPFFFPKMLERYFFLADLLSLALAISYRDRATIFIAFAVQSASLLSLLTYMYFYSWAYPTLVGMGFSTSALIVTFVIAWQNGARWPAYSGSGNAAGVLPLAIRDATHVADSLQHPGNLTGAQVCSSFDALPVGDALANEQAVNQSSVRRIIRGR